MIDHGANVIIQTQDPLRDLIAFSFNCQIISPNEFLPEVDFQIPLGSLPFLFNSTLESLPSYSPYLKVSDDKVFQWKERLGNAPHKLNIAIACSGNLSFDLKNGNPRNIPLEKFHQFIDCANIYLIQKDLSERDLSYLDYHPEIINLGPKINSFEDSAAIIMNMDLVISIDTSVAHLSGALGKPTKVLLPWVADWRWMLNSEESPWYPSLKLYRQSKIGSWDDALEAVNRDLKNFDINIGGLNT
jgi:ADP-heptose:LPS heptosyltransferase